MAVVPWAAGLNIYKLASAMAVPTMSKCIWSPRGHRHRPELRSLNPYRVR